MRKAFRGLMLAGVAAVATITVTSRPAYALFGAGDVVFDPTANENLMVQYAEQLRQAATQLQQLEQQVQTYEQMVRNATSLGNLPKVLNTLGLDTGSLTGGMDALKSVNALYSITTTGQAFTNDARSALNTNGFTLPSMDINTFRSLAGNLASGSGSSAVNSMSNGYNRNVVGTNQYIQSAGVLSDVQTQRANLATSLNDQLEQAANLGDNSEGATLQTLVALQGTAARQNDLLVRVGTVSADSSLQERLQRLQVETDIAEADIRNTQARQAYSNAPVHDVTTFGWTAQ